MGFLLTTAHRRLQKAAGAGGALGAARNGLLMAIAEDEGGTSMADVGRQLELTPSALSGLVDRAEAGELVRRVADEEDGRAWRLVLTPSGRARRRAGAAHANRLNERLQIGFTPAEIDVVARWLEATRSLEEDDA